MLFAACSQYGPENPAVKESGPLSLEGMAKMFAQLPLDSSHLQEVYEAVGASSGNGYDEEYTMGCLMNNPGTGVGSPVGTKAANGYKNPLRNLIRNYFEEHPGTKASVDEMLEAIARSDYQLYWPYSEDWDGVSYPIITFDPGYGAESNYGYAISYNEDGTRVVDSVFVNEKVARKRPVWVLNSNSDAAFTPLELFAAGPAAKRSSSVPSTQSRPRKLLMKSFRMLRNYDSWFGGASEFFIKCGSVEGFNASTEAELKLYTPSVTDFMVVVKRKYVGQELPFEAMLVSDFTQQLDKLAFLIIEDDGGTRTSWKCQAMVKIQSKTYGLDLDIPYNEKDDIVWRGQLSAHYFEEEDIVAGRFGDVIVSFELD